MKKYGKLVRDLVPARIKAEKKTVVSHLAKHDELKEKIGRKLFEEINEFATAKNAEELIDVMEVVNAIETFGKHSRPSREAIVEWVSLIPKLDDEEDVLKIAIATLDDAANEYVGSRSDKAFGELVIELEKVILITGFDRDTLEAMRMKKLETHGGFEFGTILDEA